MNTSTKTLHIPRFEALDDNITYNDIYALLEKHGVTQSIDRVNWADSFPYQPSATFTAAHSGKNLYIDFCVQSCYLRAVNYANQSSVSQDSCVEVFLQPQVDGAYWNFEFNCIGAINASHRYIRPNPTRLSAEELALIRRYPSCGITPFEEIKGSFLWHLLVVIPFSLMGIDNITPGTEIRGNFYECASASSAPHFLSWNAINIPKPDFHRPDFFGTIIFE
ncbi:MAG: hypothetical protein J1F05_00765 [Muribaculaceae bacterium]|nr:hypothetical protein [Muribaculaceae bacterium]